MNITIGGQLGSGRDSVARELVKSRFYYDGFCAYKSVLANNLGVTKGVEATDANIRILQAAHPCYKEVEAIIEYLERRDGECVVNSDVGFIAAPDSFKVYLVCNSMVAASRCSGNGFSAEGMDLRLGMEYYAEKLQIEEDYGVSITDFSNYDLVVDTTFATPSEVASLIRQMLHDGVGNTTVIEFSPKSIIPGIDMEDLGDLDSSYLNDNLEIENYCDGNLLYVRDTGVCIASNRQFCRNLLYYLARDEPFITVRR